MMALTMLRRQISNSLYCVSVAAEVVSGILDRLTYTGIVVNEQHFY